MPFIMSVFDFVLHLDVHLRAIAVDYGAWAYVLFFLVIFCETGLVVTPFLPGDSVLFMLGALTASGILDFLPASLILLAAAILGDTVNYEIGKYIGPHAFQKKEARFFNKANLLKAQAFYEKWGGLAIFLGRFMPIIRTFVPFVAGIGKMRYGKFISFNVIGGLVWVFLFMGCGYLFGNIYFVKQHLTALVFGIVMVSLIPVVIGALKSRKRKDPA